MSRLPPELVLKVLGLLGWEDERSVRALLLFGATSSDMRDLAQVDSVWEAHLQRWTRARGDRGVLPARELYRTRALLDREAGDAVSHLVTGAHLRIPAIERIKQLGDDVIDFLVQANPTLESDPLDHIARSFWTARAIESISRDQAVDVWQRIAADEYDDERQAFEDGVNAFALYRGARPGEMQQLFDKKLVLDNDVLEGWNGRNPDLEEIAKAVHLKMVDLGLKPCEGRNFHRLDNVRKPAIHCSCSSFPRSTFSTSSSRTRDGLGLSQCPSVPSSAPSSAASLRPSASKPVLLASPGGCSSCSSASTRQRKRRVCTLMSLTERCAPERSSAPWRWRLRDRR